MHVKKAKKTLALLPAEFVARAPLLDRKKTKPKYFEEDLPFKIEADGPDKISSSITKLEEQMYVYARQTEYEKAAFIQKKIKNINKKLNNGSGKY